MSHSSTLMPRPAVYRRIAFHYPSPRFCPSCLSPNVTREWWPMHRCRDCGVWIDATKLPNDRAVLHAR